MCESAGNKRPFSNMHSIDRETPGDEDSISHRPNAPLRSPQDVPNLTDGEDRRNYILDHRIPADADAPVEYVSADWIASIVRGESPGRAVYGIGAAGDKVSLPAFQAIVAWYGLDAQNLAVRVAYEGSDDRIKIHNFAADAQLCSLGPDVRASVIYSSYISDPVVKQAHELPSTLTFSSLQLKHNESLVVMNSDAPKVPPKTALEPIGRVGLANMGNTCFMNSSLQALLHIPELVYYFGSGEYVHDLNRTNPIGCHGEVADAFARLVKETYGETHASSIRPWDFRSTIGRFNRSFASRMQQDSQEFTAFLLDSLHEDLNRVHNKPATEKPELKDSDNPNDREIVRHLAEESWKTHKLRNDSPIVDLFTGMYKSTLVCPVCAKVSITFDPFFDLTLPLPRSSVWLKTVKIVPASPSKKIISTEVILSPNSLVEELKEQVAEDFLHLHVNNDEDNICELLTVADLYDHKFYRTISDRRIVSASIDQTDEIVVYEHPELLDGSKSVLVYLRHGNDETGVPFYISLKSLQKDEIEHAVLQKIQQTQNVCDAEALNLRINVFKGTVDEISHQFGTLPVEPLEQPEPLALSSSSSDQDKAFYDNYNHSQDCNTPPPGEHPLSHHEPFEKVEPIHQHEEKPLTINTSGPSSRVSSPSPLSSPSSPSQSSVPSIDSPISENNFYRNARRNGHYGAQHDDARKELDFNDDFVLVIDTSMRFDEFAAPQVDTVTNEKADAARTAMQDQKVFTLEDSLRSFENPEVLGENDEWYCPRCKEFRRAEKKLELWRVPDILMIHLKRFSGAHSMAHKVDDLVKFPLKNLDLQHYINSSAEVGGSSDDYVYDLFAVDNHFGGMGGGHYTAYVRDPFAANEMWLDFNDSYVSSIDESQVCSSAAYLLFYRRRKAPNCTGQARAVVEKLQEHSDAEDSTQETNGSQIPKSLRDKSSTPETSSTHENENNNKSNNSDNLFVGPGQRLGSGDDENAKLPWN